MGLVLACKAFWKGLRHKEATKRFLETGSELPQLELQPKPDLAHLHLLSLLQGSGRLIDFLKEDLSQFTDAQVGAAARLVHEDCAKTLEELVTIRPVFEEREGAQITLPQGYDSDKVKIIGNVTGQGPYKGKLVHKGWRVHKRSLPKQLGARDPEVIYPAEVEVK